MAAARKRRGKEPCKVHLDLTYVQVPLPSPLPTVQLVFHPLFGHSS